MGDFRRYLKSMRRLLLTSLLLSAFAACAASNAFASPAFYDGISEDGEVAVFSTSEKLVPGDTDQEADVYVRAFDGTLGELVTREVSIGPRGGNDTRPARYDGIAPDGTRVFFSTEEPLVQEDTDSQEDIYFRDLVHKETVLVSKGDDSCAGSACGNGDADAGFASRGVAADGNVVFFTTIESLDSLDTDGSSDIYARRISAGETVLVSAGDPSCLSGSCGNGSEGASYKGVDEGGDKAVFTTAESLSPADGDATADIYERDLNAGTTTLVSVADTCPSEPCTLSYGAISPNGAHVFFETSERLSNLDSDTSQDVYDWSGAGAPALVSIGPSGGNGGKNARYAKTSDDGKAVYFATTESLVSADGDEEAEDVYRNLEGTTTLVSAGEGAKGNGPAVASLDWVSPASSSDRAIFSTSESMVAGDSDLSQDVYERSGGVTTLVSTGSEAPGGAFNAAFAAASEDGSKVFFVTAEKLVSQDTDNSNDVYRRSAAGTVRVSFGQVNGNREVAAVPQGVSTDGSTAFFTTQEPLTEGDNDSEQDVYAWSESGSPLLVSRGNGASLGPPPPLLDGTTPPSPDSSTTPTIIGSAAAGAEVKVYKTTGCTGPVVAEGTAAQLASPGLTVTVQTGVTTFFSATAEYEGISSTCSSPISYKQEDAPPPPPPVEEGGTGGSGGGGGTASSGGSTAASGGTKGAAGTGGHVQRGVSYVTPLPRITFAPAAKTRLRRPTFRFLDATGQPDTRFFCRVDKQRWAQCTSPLKVRKVKRGRHVFSVKAVNALGVPGASPVKRAFKVVR
jgi:hypothetical protein